MYIGTSLFRKKTGKNVYSIDARTINCIAFWTNGSKTYAVCGKKVGSFCNQTNLKIQPQNAVAFYKYCFFECFIRCCCQSSLVTVGNVSVRLSSLLQTVLNADKTHGMLLSVITQYLEPVFTPQPLKLHE